MSSRLKPAAGNQKEKVRILLVPGFVADTYCEIERSYVELCAAATGDVEFLWLVPEIGEGYDNFTREESRHCLREPVYVEQLRAKGIPFVVGRISKYNLVANARLFGRLFRDHRIDAVYTHFGYERFWATFFGRLYGRVTIWNEHWHSLGMRYAVAKRLFYRLFVDEFIAVSRFLARSLPAGARIHTIENGIWPGDLGRPKGEERARRRAALGIPTDAIMLIMAAAFHPQKRHGIALDICEQLLKRRTDLVFVFLGDGPMRPTFLATAKKRGVDRYVVAPGYVRNVDEYCAVADIAMLTSDREGFGYAVLEAMRYGLPVVVFNSGAPAEIIEHGETGFVVPDGDKEQFAQVLLRLIHDARLREAVGERARLAVRERYDREAWIRKLSATLQDIVRAHRGGADAHAMREEGVGT